jgi:tetratricopeptide (TPR) repeat protein
MLSWKKPSAAHAVSIAFAVSIAAAQLPLLASASQTPKTTGSAAASPAPCEELSKKGRALLDAGKSEEARTFLTAGIQTCAGAASQPEKSRLAAALITLGFVESPKQPQEALEHFRRAMALDPENMRGPLNAGAMLTTLGQFTEALDVLEKALKHGTDDKDTLFRLEYNAGFALLKMCAARQAGCERGSMEQHFLRASELNPSFPDTWFNLAAITNDVHRDSRAAMELFKKACDLGHERGCLQYESFKSRIGALDRQAQGASPTEMTAEALAERIRPTYTCAAVVKSARQPSEPGMAIWAVECSGNHLYTVIVGMRGETTVIQRSK